jgi:glycosyltransferase involved in cell wall biosynthesis
MRALVLLPYPWDSVPGQRYRFEQWRPYLEAAGVRCDVRTMLTADDQRLLHSARPLPLKLPVIAASVRRALAAVPASRDYDIVWIYRTLLVAGPSWIERRLHARGTPIVYEFDDAIWLTKTFASNRAVSFLKFSGKTASLCRMASSVIVGNETLAAWARQHNTDVTIVPSTVDVDRYTPVPREKEPGAPIVLGFSGSPTTVEYLHLIGGALQRVARQRAIQLRVMGAGFSLPGVDVTVTPWSSEREIEELRSYDIGLMPLADDPWTRGKGAMKALLYMSVGVPVVASPVGITTDILSDGANGRLCRTEDEWVAALLALAADPALRRRLGDAGRETVMQRFSPHVHVPRVVEVLERTVALGRRSL